MCSNCIFREFIPIAVAFRGLEHGLLLALTEIERLGDLEDLGDFEELLLWVYFVGGMVSTTTETEWFAFRVAKSMANLGFQDWEEVENSLARCLWTEKMQNRYCVTFWDMVTRSRETSEEGAGYNATVGRCLE